MNRLFSNRGVANYVINPYQEQISQSSEILIAAPYVTKTEQLVVAAQAGKKISLIVGINECTSPQALFALVGLPNCAVRYFTTRFHAKIYVFDEAALIGSSNLTDGGLVSNREATLLVEDSEDLEEARRLFLELWESAQTLTPDKLKAFAKIHVRPAFQDGNPRYADAVGGKVEPPNIKVNSARPNAARMFAEQLRRQVYEQYKPAFTEVLETLRQGSYRRADLEDLGIAYETNRFLNWVRLTHAPGENWAQAPLRANREDRVKEIKRLGQEWVGADKNQVSHDYTDMLRNSQRVFGTADSIDKASKDDLSEGLLSLHAFLEQLRFVKGGRENLAPFFWRENNDDVHRVKKSLTRLVHGHGDFIERLHDLVYDPAWWLEHFGTFCALELFGTIKPEEFPPINGRMAKALRFLGYDVKTS
jgi:phospholipase D-like protein